MEEQYNGHSPLPAGCEKAWREGPHCAAGLEFEGAVFCEEQLVHLSTAELDRAPTAAEILTAEESNGQKLQRECEYVPWERGIAVHLVWMV